jgi:hypothetical protein
MTTFLCTYVQFYEEHNTVFLEVKYVTFIPVNVKTGLDGERIVSTSPVPLYSVSQYVLSGAHVQQ